VEDLKAPDGLAEWMSQQGLGDGPLEDVSKVSGGTQNIMLRFTRSGRPYVLRRGPKHLRASDRAAGLAKLPATGSVVVGGRRYHVRSFHEPAWDGERVTIWILM